MDQDKVASARGFAVLAHGKQMYGKLPYYTHLDAVAEICEPYGPLAQIVAYLHDVVEDTDVEPELITLLFGDHTSSLVAILTDEPGKNRVERKRKTYAKMFICSKTLELALLVKAADRLANVRGGTKNDMYRKEHDAFAYSVYRQGLCDEVWEELDSIMLKEPNDK